MPTKHINDNTWRLVEKETVKAVIELKEPVKDTEVLDWLIRKGIEAIDEDDYRKFSKGNTEKIPKKG